MVCDALMTDTPTKVDECIQIEGKKRYDVTKERAVFQKVAVKSKTDRIDRSVIFQRVKESESIEPKTRFQHDTELIKHLLDQDIYDVTLLKIYSLGSRMNLTEHQTRLVKLVFKSFNERELIPHNEHELKWSNTFVRNDFQSADRIKSRKVEKELKCGLDTGGKDHRVVNFQVVRLR